MDEDPEESLTLIAADRGEMEEILDLVQPKAVLGDSPDQRGDYLYVPLGRWAGLCDRPSEFYRTMQQLPEPVFIVNAEHLCRDQDRSLDIRLEMVARMLQLSRRRVICAVPTWIAQSIGDLTTATIQETDEWI